MTLTISLFGNPGQNHKHNYERSVNNNLHNYYTKVQKSNYYYELLKNFARKKIVAWETCNLFYLKHLNKIHQGIKCEI